jgi:hypothetical protein
VWQSPTCVPYDLMRLVRVHLQVIFARVCGATSFFDDIWEGVWL